MSLGVVLFFAIGTFAEMYLLTIVSASISVINTLSLIMFTFLIGNIINRSWGKEYFDKMQWHLRSRSVPGDDVLNGSVLALSGMFLITPGVITDIIGILIVLPFTRFIFKDITESIVKKKISNGELHYFFKD
ncbi:MAG: FxsA family protein [Nitrospinaceae bacterium]|jgi:UPF0716 protein FxsA|tara:strand:+ start:263 stop:658 length:396 start_codon:yes stop_codon:yes gene_type:complete